MQLGPRGKAILLIVLGLGIISGLILSRSPEPDPVSPAADAEVLPNRTVASESRTATTVEAPPGVDEADDLPVSEGSSANSLADALRSLGEKPGVVPGELLLQFRSPSDIAALRSRSAGLGITVLWSDARLSSARIAYEDADALARELEGNADAYESIAPNYLMQIPGLPEEPDIALDPDNSGGTVPFRETLLESIGAVGDRSQWGEGVTVAILDSGILDHPSLENVDINQIDLSTANEINGHGTAMASLVAGSMTPAEGIAPATSLLDLRVTDENGVTNTGLVAEGILAAADQRVDVINVSLGSFGNSAVLRAAIDYARERNILVVAAAGNEQTTRLAYPAAYEGVISVGAVDAENTQAYFSNSGETLSISAPGVGIFSAYTDGQLAMGSGTSQATAITSGVISVLLSRGYRPAEIPGLLAQYALATGAPREQVGAGVIQLP